MLFKSTITGPHPYSKSLRTDILQNLSDFRKTVYFYPNKPWRSKTAPINKRRNTTTAKYDFLSEMNKYYK